MILYTEAQLMKAYKEYIKTFRHTPKLEIPTLEQFRVIFEEFWDDYYEQKRTIN